jgi:hypothetical protein
LADWRGNGGATGGGGVAGTGAELAGTGGKTACCRVRAQAATRKMTSSPASAGMPLRDKSRKFTGKCSGRAADASSAIPGPPGRRSIMKKSYPLPEIY